MTTWIIQVAFVAIAIAFILGAYIASRDAKSYSHELTEAFHRAENTEVNHE